MSGGLPGLGGVPGLGGMDEEDEEGEDETEGPRIYKSLPRLIVKYKDAKVPQRANILSHPRSVLLSARTLDGPWTKIYQQPSTDDDEEESGELPPLPVGVKAPKETVTVSEDQKRTMKLDALNELSITPTSCFGKRGPLYIVACAVNQSSYDDAGQWANSKESRFVPGQKVMPPPFNDRCVAVSGRCGHACESGNSDPVPFCNADGYIDQSALAFQIPIKYNRVTPVFCFAYVLLFGFAVKTVMLCPGIFSPYKRCSHYSSDLTDQFRYIMVVGVTGGGDEGKGTMIRNTIGMVSGLPPNSRCRFVVCNNEEGHRLEMLTCWEKFCAVLAAIPMDDGQYETNLRAFTHIWVDETRVMRLRQVGAKVKQLDPAILSRLSGKTALEKARKTLHWDRFGPAFEGLCQAVEELHQDLDTNYNKFTPMIAQCDYVRDWVPPDTTSLLRMHFTSRAKPVEDPRNIMVQHVAVGTWYYKAPPNPNPQNWLEMRKNCQEMVYSRTDDDLDEGFTKVPLRSSHGKAGGLNFVDNYISVVNDRMENRYGTPDDGPDCKNDQDRAPSLYAIADARHQFQPDFMISCIPCFFDTKGWLNHRVAFTQAPQHYPEYADKNDYLDNNNAQFFRLNAMIRNCCGGVSSCGTNGMWQLPDRDNDETFWLHRLKRVRDRDGELRTEMIEREQFHTSCKIEDTASSLDRVLVGEYSQFVNRKLSFGMSKDPEGFLGAQQRWVEGAITLCLQWVTNHADAHGQAKKNQPLLWLVILAFIFYIVALLRMVTKQYTSSFLVELGLMPPGAFDSMIRTPLHPMIHGAYELLLAIRGGHSPNSYSYKVYEDMTLQFVVFMLTCVFMFGVLWIITNCARLFRGSCSFPWEMKWWGRLLISFDNLTYWIWFWTSFFWIGFNIFLAVFPANFHFNNIAMMSFLLAATFLNYALIISNSMRFSLMESIDANEIAFLSMDNIWRANQLFFMVGPIQGFSVFTGTKNFLSYLMYGQDIGGWSGGDLTQISIAIVKYWTTMIITASICCWVYLFTSSPTEVEYQSRRPGCLIFSFIAMDVLHPCVYLWTIGASLSAEELGKMSWFQKLTSTTWWKTVWAALLLNECTTNMFRFVAPAYNFMLPLLVFYNSAFGVGGGFTLVAVGAGH